MKWIIGFFILAGYLMSAECWAREVEFSWDPVDAASKYEIQISDTQKFDKPLQAAQSDKPKHTANLGLGHYYYRVRVVDLKGRPGRWSQPSKVTVTPYAPDLLDPKTGYETDYFELPPTLEFSWKPVEGNPEYEILIYKTSGQKILEAAVADTKFKTDKVGEGEYMWKVRSVAQKAFTSPYCEPRRFLITKKPLTPPELITPAQDGMSAAYRPVAFTWKQDPATKLTDLTYEKLSGRQGAKPFKKTIPNLTGSNYTAEYEEPGEYRWSIVTKEAKTTQGIGSSVHGFEVRDDVITRGNYELEFSMSPASDLYATTSTRQTGGTPVATDATSNGNFTGFLGGYYFLESLGLFMSTRTAQMNVNGVTAYAQESDATLRMRFGSKGFAQEFWFGYRIMDLVQAENTPANLVTNFTALGGLTGTRLTATVAEGWKAQFSILYYKPTAIMEGTPGFTADIYQGSLGVKWNFMYQFWLGYRFSTTRINGIYQPPNQPENINATWTMYRTEPFFFSISFEH
jgi:hypothetical protein